MQCKDQYGCCAFLINYSNSSFRFLLTLSAINSFSDQNILYLETFYFCFNWATYYPCKKCVKIWINFCSACRQDVMLHSVLGYQPLQSCLNCFAVSQSEYDISSGHNIIWGHIQFLSIDLFSHVWIALNHLSCSWGKGLGMTSVLYTTLFDVTFRSCVLTSLVKAGLLWSITVVEGGKFWVWHHCWTQHYLGFP